MNNSQKKALWWTLAILVVLIVVVACFYAIVDRRGIAAWNQCRRELAARGESVNWKDFIPAPVPDAQNFYKAPKMTEWFVHNPTNQSTVPFYARLNNPETISTNAISEMAASNYLAWCATFEPEFDQMRAALKRPCARINGDYNYPFQMSYPSFVMYRIVIQTLAHSAKCHLIRGEPKKALANLTLIFDLNKTLVPNDRPTTLVAGMIHVAIAGLYAEAVAFGIQSKRWDKTELKTLQKQLSEIRLLPVMDDSLRVERAGVCHTIKALSTGQLPQSIFGGSKTDSTLSWRLFPSGWIYQNMTVVATLEQHSIDGINLGSNTIVPGKFNAATLRTKDLSRQLRPWNYIAAICLPNFNKAAQTLAYNQTMINETMLACALERYRLVHDAYPATLDALTPQFIKTIPHDIIGGQPLHYRRTDAGEFQLYSVGWNGTDDGGQAFTTSTNGDWIWSGAK